MTAAISSRFRPRIKGFPLEKAKLTQFWQRTTASPLWSIALDDGLRDADPVDERRLRRF